MSWRGYEPPDRSEVLVDRPTKERDVERADQLQRDVWVRGQDYRLSEDEARVLWELGRFRVLRQEDAKGIVSADPTRWERALRSLGEQKFIKRLTLTSPHDDPCRVITLTRLGHQVLCDAAGESHQQFYSGFVKLREMRHDTAVYRMYQVEADRLEKMGSTVCRVVLDYELKREIFSALEKEKRTSQEGLDAVRKSVAARWELAVVDGTIALPDLRIEYRTANGEQAHVDLELATGHYKASQLAAKARAGFQVYHLTPSGRSSGTPRGENLLREVFSR